MIKCDECGNEFNERIVTMWQKVIGWEHKRHQGGTNHLSERVPLNVWRCDGCMRKSLAGTLGQERLEITPDELDWENAVVKEGVQPPKR